MSTSTSTVAPRSNGFGATCTVCRQWVEPGHGTINKSGGRWLTKHNACPAPKAPKAPAAQPELGYYVREDGAAIKVVESKSHKGRVYGLVFTARPAPQRPVWLYVRGAGLSVADMRPMTATDAAALGLSHGHCIACCAPLGGKTLSAHVSAIVGYGEQCAATNGWPYPKGVKAQRACLDAAADE
jgi:ribosomal protein L24E